MCFFHIISSKSFLTALSSRLSLPQLFPTVSCTQPTTNLLIFLCVTLLSSHICHCQVVLHNFHRARNLSFPFEGRRIVCLSFITWYHSFCLDFGRHLLGVQRQLGRISRVFWDDGVSFSFCPSSTCFASLLRLSCLISGFDPLYHFDALNSSSQFHPWRLVLILLFSSVILSVCLCYSFPFYCFQSIDGDSLTSPLLMMFFSQCCFSF